MQNSNDRYKTCKAELNCIHVRYIVLLGPIRVEIPLPNFEISPPKKFSVVTKHTHCALRSHLPCLALRNFIPSNQVDSPPRLQGLESG